MLSLADFMYGISAQHVAENPMAQFIVVDMPNVGISLFRIVNIVQDSIVVDFCKKVPECLKS